jgi:hypothetical protein
MDENLDRRAAALKDWIALHPESMIITTYSTSWRAKIAPILFAWNPDALINDEVQKGILHHTSKQSKFAHRIAVLPSVRCRIGLGRVIKNGPQDLFSIYKWLDSTVFPRTWKAFADRYLTFGWFNEINGSKNEDEILRKLSETSSQIDRSQVWGGIPTRLDQEWPVILSEESSKRYQQFAKAAVAAVQGTDIDGNVVTGTLSADLVITQAMRLMQLVGGHTKIDGQIVDVSSEKIDTAIELTEQTVDEGEQVVLFAAFRREIARLRDRLHALYPNQVGVIQGGITESQRDVIFTRFKEGSLRILIVQNQTGSQARDMSEASVGIVVSTGYDIDDFEQAIERLTGIDPNRAFAYYYLQATMQNGKPTIDKRIYDKLKAKQRIAGRFSISEARDLLRSD